MDTKIQVSNSESGITYTAGKQIGGTEIFTTYECSSLGNSSDNIKKNECLILKITTDPKYNGTLDKEAYILKAMFNEAARLEDAFLKANPETEMRRNYHFHFPNLVETFVSEEQKSRRILILSLDNIASNLKDLVPLSHLELKEHVRVDHRTSAWIMGKQLRGLAFIQSMRIINNTMCRNNILINRNDYEHFAILFDWSNAQIQNQIDQQKGGKEIAQLAQAITRTLGGNLKTGELPADEQSDAEYGKFIRKLALGKENDAQKAHHDFYTLIDKLWPREHYPFTTHPLSKQ